MLRVLLAAVAALLLAAPAGARRSQPALLVAMNRVRAQHGLPPLRIDRNLRRAAWAHSRTMLADGALDHGAFSTRMAQYGVAGHRIGENLGWGTGAGGSPRAIVVAWLRSPEHRANLLRPSFTRVGVGDVVGTFQGYAGAHVVTADFAG